MIVGHVIARLARGMVVGIVHRWFSSLLVVGLIAGAVYGLAVAGDDPGARTHARA